MGAHHARQTHKQPALARNAGGQLYQTRQCTRELDDGHRIRAPKSITALEAHHHIQRLVCYLREWMGRVERHWHQQRFDLTHKVLVDPGTLRSRALLVRDDANAPRTQGRHQRLVEQGILPGHHLLGLGQQSLAGAGTCGVVRALAQSRNMRQRAHLKKLIQVGRNNAQIAQALQQGHILTRYPVQHTLIKTKNTGITLQQGQSRGKGIFWHLQCRLYRGAWRHANHGGSASQMLYR